MTTLTKEELIAFERGIADLWEAGQLPYLLHLSGGNEEALIDIFRDVQPGDWVLSTHRNHYHYLLSGGSPERLRALICDGRSMFVYGQPVGEDPTLQVNFLCSSILAGTCAIAAGIAWDIKSGRDARSAEADSPAGRRCHPRVWCFLGDGAEDEGHYYEAVRFVEGHGLPCTFIIEDNNRSVDTTRAARQGENHWSPTFAYRPPCVRAYYYTPTWPHAGSGCKHNIVFAKKPAPDWS